MILKKSYSWRVQKIVGTASFAALVGLACLLPGRAHAYLDPGTGSYVVQIIIGVVLGAGYTLKVYGARILQKITGRSKDEAQGKVKRLKGKGGIEDKKLKAKELKEDSKKEAEKGKKNGRPRSKSKPKKR